MGNIFLYGISKSAKIKGSFEIPHKNFLPYTEMYDFAQERNLRDHRLKSLQAFLNAHWLIIASADSHTP